MSERVNLEALSFRIAILYGLQANEGLTEEWRASLAELLKTFDYLSQNWVREYARESTCVLDSAAVAMLLGKEPPGLDAFFAAMADAGDVDEHTADLLEDQFPRMLKALRTKESKH